jgi:hypothetical protein
LGSPDAENFNCRESSSEGDVDVSETCELGWIHELVSGGGADRMFGIVKMDLPINGLGYLHSDNPDSAEEQAQGLIDSNAGTITWRVEVLEDGEAVASEGIDLGVSVVTHELVSVQEFKLDPLQESVYSFATLVGCFSLLLIIPLMVYFSAMYKAKRDERVRMETPEAES